MRVSKYAVAGMLVGTILTTTTASAEDMQCTISGTGPDSVNTCLEYVGRSCTQTNNNIITITDSNSQQGSSGDANQGGDLGGENEQIDLGLDGNTNGGDADTGDVTNHNTSNIEGTIDNTGACVAAVATTTPTPTPTTPEPEQPAGHVESAQVEAPVGGVSAGTGGADHSGLIVGTLGASMLAIGVGLRKLGLLRQS